MPLFDNLIKFEVKDNQPKFDLHKFMSFVFYHSIYDQWPLRPVVVRESDLLVDNSPAFPEFLGRNWLFLRLLLLHHLIVSFVEELVALVESERPLQVLLVRALCFHVFDGLQQDIVVGVD